MDSNAIIIEWNRMESSNGLEWKVLACEGGLGEEQRAGIAGGGVEKVRGLVPVVGDRGIGALG